MERRFEAYKSAVVRPFFREHFARLDRQIVLIDTLAAFNAGPAALHDLENAFAAILACFRAGRNSFASMLLRPRIDRILFAATKADHLHHTSHDRLERILARMTERAAARAALAGARIDVVALAAVRATREATVDRGRERLPSIVGTPSRGERAGQETFDGTNEVAVFPGDLPDDAEGLFGSREGFRGLTAGEPHAADYRFLRFRPPAVTARKGAALPHIRLDRALQFLLGDRLA
jgi:predicted YcjX-like family ATPase